MAKTSSEEPQKKLSWSEWKNAGSIFSFILPYKWYFLGAMLLLVLGSLIFLVFPIMMGEMTDIATGEKNTYTLQQLGVALFVLLAIQAVFSYLRVILFAHVSEKAMADVRSALYQKLISLPLFFFEKNRIGDLTSRITNDVAQLQSVFSSTLAEFLRQLILLISGIVILMVTTPKLSYIMFLCFPIIVIGAIFFGRFVRKLSKLRQKQLADTNTTVVETLQNIADVKAFTNEYYENKRYKSAIREVVNIALKLAKYRALLASFIIAVLFGAIFFILYQGFSLVLDGQMSIGELVTFITFTGVIGAAIGGLSNFYAEIVKAAGGTERIREILNEEAEVPTDFTADKIKLIGEIRFDKVNFSYPTRSDIEVLKEVSFKISPGQKIALVGQSGSGKSTIAKLIMRFYNVTSGNIEIDGKVVSDYPIHTLRKSIGIVPQEVMLFGGSIRENILYGRPEASEDDILNAARLSHSLEFIEQLPEKFETTVGERGIQLSGGQRQRIAIARAILKDPEILILDEATSSLDAESESLVQSALENLMKNRTSVIIAHRLSTIKDCDLIYVLESGTIVESGSHEELYRQEDGIYQNLVRLQYDQTPVE